jgi:hypothetical protein
MKAQPGSRIEPRDPEPRTGDSKVTERNAEASPRFKARMAGVFYLLEGTMASFGEVFVVGQLVVSSNAAATATNVLAHESLLRWGFAAALIAVACHIVYTVLFYDLFKPVNRSISLLAAFFSLVAIALQAFSSLFEIAPLIVLGGDHSLSAFKVEQLQALALMFLKLNMQAFNIYLVFFGFWLVLTGYLIFRSTFMPRILGVLLAIDGLGWMTFLSPPLAHHLFPFIATASGLAEIPLILWLLVFGVNAQRWNEQASAAAVRA